MIDPSQNRFIQVSLYPSWQYIAYHLSWQLAISFFLLATLTGCFVYLFQTIFKQHQLATLKKSFVDNMTHELRTPLATVSAAIQALKSYTPEEDRDRRELYLNIAKDELDHLAATVDNVLHVAESDRPQLKLHLEAVNLVNLIETCWQKTAVKFKDREVTFQFIPPTAPLVVQADRTHLKNAFSNLLDNAVKYGSTTICVIAKHTDTSANIQIIDNGIGIAQEYQAQVFEAFFRVPQGDLHATKGFGLGLAYVQHIVRLHGGSIAIESKPGEGSTFVLQIPLTTRDD